MYQSFMLLIISWAFLTFLDLHKALGSPFNAAKYWGTSYFCMALDV